MEDLYYLAEEYQEFHETGVTTNSNFSMVQDF